MASSSNKLDHSSGSPERPTYNSAQRGYHAVSQLDRSGSFRESMESPASSSLSAGARNTSAQADLSNFFQCLPFDSKLLALDHKSNRHGEIKRSVAVALGLPPDSPSNVSKAKLVTPPSQEEIKRVKLSLGECSGKARERVRTFSEALSLMNKCFPSLSSKKRSRPVGFSNDRSGPMLSSDRSILGNGPGKVGSQNIIPASGFEHELPKSEERTKKRPRTSLIDLKLKVHGHVPVGPSEPVDRERDLQKLTNSSSVQCDDRTLPIGVDGWEKLKTKKKRSGIKPDVSSGTASAKPVDSHRELKQGIQQRSTNDIRMRMNSDVHGVRQGFNGVLRAGKSEASSQQTSSNARVSSPKVDHDATSLPIDKRDRPLNSDKEKMNLKATNKISGRDDVNSASPVPSTRTNASVRGPWASSGVAPKLSQVMNRANNSNDLEIPHPTSRPPAALGSNNRKRTASARVSSPPTSQWTGQHQKTSRTGRRTNLGPTVSSNDEASPMDTTSDVGGNDGGGFARRLSVNSPQLVKLKGDRLSSSTISEGEDSGAAEIRSRDRVKKSDEVDQKSSQHVKKVSNLTVPSRKNKLVLGEDHGDGVRRQGGSGRGFTSATSVSLSRGEKLGNGQNAKQLRTTRPGPDRTESKASRPLTRKLSDRKSYARQRHTSINASADFLVGSDNGHDELLAAANAVVNPTPDSLKSLWKKIEPLFGFISDIDINYLKEQVNFGYALQTPKLDIVADTDGLSSTPNGFMLSEGEQGTGAMNLTRISLFERCLSALIPEEDAITISGNDELRYDACGSSHELNDDLDSNGFTCQSSQQSGSVRNGYMTTGIPEYSEHVNAAGSFVRMGGNLRVEFPMNGLLTDHLLTPSVAYSESLYESIDVNEKIILELQSVAISPETMHGTDREESADIKDEIDKLLERYHGQVAKKNRMLDRLLESAVEMKESEEREFEQLALDKLLAMSFEKYMVSWGPSGGKSATSKMAKQASVAFVKRTLDRCRQFEETGKSCFSEPLFKEILHTGSSRVSLARITAIKSAQQNQLISHLGQTVQYDINSSDMLNHLPEQDKEDAVPNRVKKRELLLEEVVGGNSFSALTSSAKGKRSDRDREGKALSRAGNTRGGRSAVSNAKGERKSKAKPKQKTQLSVSINGLVGNSFEQTKTSIVSSTRLTGETNAGNTKEKVKFGVEELEEPLDFSQLQLPGIDDLGISDDFGGQGQDLASWLNIDDDNLQDQDFMGLEIPMDDLTDLNMMV